MFNRGHNLETRRNEIIMACLSGGQHIDAALEAADRLVPQSEIDEAWAEDKRLGDEWLDSQIERMRARSAIATKNPEEPTKPKPWYVSALERWGPF